MHSWFSLVFSRFALASCSPGEVDAVGNAITLHLQQDAQIELGLKCGYHGQHGRPEMTRLSGSFVTLKDEGRGRLWTVQLESFLIGRYAVTQELFQLIARDREAPLPDARKPVVHVSWIESTRFCNLLSRKVDLRE